MGVGVRRGARMHVWLASIFGCITVSHCCRDLWQQANMVPVWHHDTVVTGTVSPQVRISQTVPIPAIPVARTLWVFMYPWWTLRMLRMIWWTRQWRSSDPIVWFPVTGMTKIPVGNSFYAIWRTSLESESPSKGMMEYDTLAYVQYTDVEWDKVWRPKFISQ